MACTNDYYFIQAKQTYSSKTKHNETEAWFRGVLCHLARKHDRACSPAHRVHMGGLLQKPVATKYRNHICAGSKLLSILQQ